MRSMIAQGLILCFAGLSFVVVAGANPFYVAPAANGGDDANDGLSWDSPKATPNAAVAAAVNDGDEVIVSNGVYALSAALTIGKSITLRSLDNDYNTVVFDGGGGNRNITITATATNALVAGVTISNSVASSYGGGISIQSMNATVSNCLLTANTGTRGGGMYMAGGKVTDSFFTGNSTTGPGYYGDAIYVYNASAPTYMVRCVFSNAVSRAAAAVDLDRNHEQATIISGCLFIHNTNGTSLVIGSAGEAVAEIISTSFASNSNGAVRVNSAGTGIFSNCTFTGNAGSANTLGVSGKASVYDSSFVGNRTTGGSGEIGGAITAVAGLELAIDRCQFLYNIGVRAGGIAFGGKQAVHTVRNSLFYGNEAEFGIGGGGIYANWDASIENCTLVGNSGSGCGGIYFRGQTPSDVQVLNSIIHSNTPPAYGKYAGDNYTFAHTCIAPTGTAGYVWGAGNIEESPRFINPGSGYGLDHLAGEYRLDHGSPAIDAGVYRDWMTSALDLDGRKRVIGSAVDMGCFERPLVGSMFIFR